MSYDNPLTPEDVDDSATNPMSSPIECIIAMFLMSLTNFGDYYAAFEKTEHEYVAKVSMLILNEIVLRSKSIVFSYFLLFIWL